MAESADSNCPIAVLISGSGTTLRNLIERIGDGRLAGIRICLVISSNESARGLEFARDAGIRRLVVQPAAYDTVESFSEAIFAACRAARVRLVAMGGFLKRIVVPADFEHRVLNIHPSLIPAFCGAGFYGRRVHEAVLAYGAKISGCTVHFVDQQYDHGPIVLQRSVPVLDDDTPEVLAARVFEQECEAYPEAIRLAAAGLVHVKHRHVRIESSRWAE